MSSRDRTPQVTVEPALWCTMQVAAFLGVHRRKVAQFLNEELIPKPITLASYPKWRREELEDWVAADCPEQDNWKW